MTVPSPFDAAPGAASPTTAPLAPIAQVRDYGDPLAEYAALRRGAMLVDHSARARWTFRGPKARETLTGLVTNDVIGLTPGQGLYAAALTAKGKIVADVRIHALDAGFADGAGAPSAWLDGAALVVDVPSRAADGWSALVRKYVNPRATAYRDEGARLRAFGVYGIRARDAVAAALGAPSAALAQLAPYGHATATLGAATVLVARVPDLGLDGFVLHVPAEAYDVAWARVAAGAPGVVAAGEHAYAVARVEAGYPEWGVDVDDTTIPQEANFDELHAISYTKGCYTGQEVVARVHFRGHVNRHLRGIAYPADASAPGTGEPTVPRGAQLLDEGGKVVGEVRSSVVSPRLGGVALAMVRREVALGALLTARWEHEPSPATGERHVTVAQLPFPL
jgi:folate-binding protein YgfZ